jgi:hypothetical protein
MLSKQEEQIEREAVQENDRRVREQQQTSTNLDHARAAANDTAGGRYAGVSPTTVVGTEPGVKYPQLPASSPWSGSQPEPGIEPPLGFDNPALDESSAGATSSPADTGGAEAPSFSASDVEHAAPPSSSTEGSSDDNA